MNGTVLSAFDYVHRADAMQSQLQERAFFEAIKFSRRTATPLRTPSLIDVSQVVDFTMLDWTHVCQNLATGRCPSGCGGSLMRHVGDGDFYVCSSLGCASKVLSVHVAAATQESRVGVHGKPHLLRKVDDKHPDSQSKRRRTTWAFRNASGSRETWRFWS